MGAKRKPVPPSSKEEERRPYVPERKFVRDKDERPVAGCLSNWRNPHLKEEFDAYLKRHKLSPTEWLRWKAEESVRNDEVPPDWEG